MTSGGSHGAHNGFSRAGSKSFKRFAAVMGIGAIVAAIVIFVVAFSEHQAELLPATIIVQPQSSSPGSPALVQGSGFSPGDEVRISFNGKEVGEMSPEVVTVGDFGGFNAEIIIPMEVERDENSIEAMDESGNVAMTTIRLTGEQAESINYAGSHAQPHL